MGYRFIVADIQFHRRGVMRCVLIEDFGFTEELFDEMFERAREIGATYLENGTEDGEMIVARFAGSTQRPYSPVDLKRLVMAPAVS